MALSLSCSSLICLKRSSCLPRGASLLVLRVQQPIEGFDLALDRLDAFDGILHVVDQAALDRFGELDLADALDTSICARMAARGAAILPLVACRRALRRLGELLVELLGAARALRTASICFCTCAALLDPLVGDLFVVEDDQLADRALAGVQLIAQLDDLLAISGVREMDLITASLPRSMRRAISTSPSRVSSGTVPISRRYMRTGSLVLSSAPGVRSSSSSSALRPCGRWLCRRAGILIGVDHFDAGAAEDVEQIVELVGRGDFRRQQLVDLVVQQVALLLADDDELPYFVVFSSIERCDALGCYIRVPRCNGVRSFFRC